MNLLIKIKKSVTNKDVDPWNAKIQKYNPNESISLFSKDKLCKVDDPNQILQFNYKLFPPHELKLKCRDI